MGQCGRAKGVGQMVEPERFDLDATGARQAGVRRGEGKPVSCRGDPREGRLAFVVASRARHESVAAYAAAAAAAVTRFHWCIARCVALCAILCAVSRCLCAAT